MILRIGILLLLVNCMYTSKAQGFIEYRHWNPASGSLKVLEGQGWPNETKDYYDRLPAGAENMVRQDVWSLSKNTAGLHLKFLTNAGEIIIKLLEEKPYQFFHMPATGVSGIDLYAKSPLGNCLWAAGKYSFGDTVIYRFSNLDTINQFASGIEYTLYLPLYNSVKWMEIIVPVQNMFKPLPAVTCKPIVVYGTSIAQGACASRPGLAWSSILGRKIGLPVVNLGFSGNGRMEEPVFQLISGLDAKVFVIDCLPNMGPEMFTSAELKKRINDAVTILQAKRPVTPILFCEHGGYQDAGINRASRLRFQLVNKAFRETYDSLIVAGKNNLYLLTKEEIGLDIESTVDGTHPNDIGMYKYANAYAKKIEEILQKK